MILTTLDSIVRRSLLERSMPIHYYAEFLFHSSACLRELSLDTLKIVNTVSLPVNDYGAVDLPADFVDEVALSLGAGALLRKIPHNDAINPIRVHDVTTGQFVAQTNSEDVDSNDNLFFGSSGFAWFWNVNDYGEPTGRFFGANGGTSIGYKVIKERRQIQLSGGFESGSIVLQYISDGQSIDNATQIDTQAFTTIQSWNDWKSSRNAGIERSPEGMTFLNMKRKLRTRLSDLTATDIKNILHTAYTATIKN